MELFAKIYNGFQSLTVFAKALSLMFDRVLNTTLITVPKILEIRRMDTRINVIFFVIFWRTDPT